MPAVVKKNRASQRFDRAKLRASMMLALRKRNVSVDLLDAAIARIENTPFTSGEARSAPRRSASW